MAPRGGAVQIDTARRLAGPNKAQARTRLAERGSSDGEEAAVSKKAPQELDEALGVAIRTRRLELKVTQQELGEMVGVAFQTIQRYENGTNRITFARLAQIAKALNTTVADFASALQPDQQPTPVFSEVQMLAIPGAVALLEEYAQLSPERRRLLVAFLREGRQPAAPEAEDDDATPGA
jgi:transcriptional regulator with XRE-family HTH domain